MIIDCHGHYTSEPASHRAFRQAQLSDLSAAVPYPTIGDDEIRQSIENNQLRLQRERQTDVTLFSPRASGMGHHLGNEAANVEWSRVSNDLIARVTKLFPDNFVGICQLPQYPGAPLAASVAELTRCVEQLGFVGCNLNPDPSGGLWDSPPLTDRYWYPLYEKMVELRVPAMIHASGACSTHVHTTGAHYLNTDNTAFMQLLQGDLFKDFPTLQLIIPHGGGAVPYHWGRFEGLAQMLSKPVLENHLMCNVSFDTCVYHEAGIRLLAAVVATSRILFGSELLGAVKANNPKTNRAFDDTRYYLESIGLSVQELSDIFESNARRVFPRLGAKLTGVVA